MLVLKESLDYICNLDNKQLKWQEELNKLKMEAISGKKLSLGLLVFNKDFHNIQYNYYLKNENVYFRNLFLDSINKLLDEKKFKTI